MLVFADCESHQAAAACQEVLELPPVLPLVPVRQLTGARWSSSGQASACGAAVSIRSDVQMTRPELKLVNVHLSLVFSDRKVLNSSLGC